MNAAARLLGAKRLRTYGQLDLDISEPGAVGVLARARTTASSLLRA